MSTLKIKINKLKLWLMVVSPWNGFPSDRISLHCILGVYPGGSGTKPSILRVINVWISIYISNKQFILCLIPAHTYILDNLWYVQLIDSLLNVTPGVFFFGFSFLLLWWFKFCFIVFSFFIFSVVAGGP